jgi:hypothetical protein
MAVPRPVLLALIGVVLLSATFLATRNARDHGDNDSSAPAAQQQAVAPAPKPSAEKTVKQRPAEKPVQRARGERARPAKRGTSKPAAVARAIAAKRVVVLAFFQPGADDRETAKSVAALKRRGMRVSVFTDKIDNVGRYGPIVGAVGVNQAPAVVIVDRDRKAHLIQGYVDPETLAQEVADVRR